METIEISKDNLDKEGSLLPPDVAENIGRIWIRGIVTDDDNGDKSSGGIVWEYKNVDEYEKDTVAEIIWAFGENREVLYDLLAAYRIQIQDESAVVSEFEIPLNQEASMLEETFSADGFKISNSESRDIYVTVKDLKGLKLGNKKSPFYIKALRDLSFRQFRDGITDVLFQDRKGLMEDIAWVSLDWFEPDISSCVVMDDIVKGFFLIHRTATGILVAELLFSVDMGDNRTVLELIRFTLRETIKKYSPETRILLRRHNDMVHSLVKKLFPDKEGEVVMTGHRREKAEGMAE